MKKFINDLSVSAKEKSITRRTKQVASVLQRELAKVLIREFELPKGILITITKITVDADFEIAKVWLSVLPFVEGEKILLRLQRVSGYLQHCVAKRLPLYRLPKFRFVLDTIEEQAGKIEAILDRINKQE